MDQVLLQEITVDHQEQIQFLQEVHLSLQQVVVEQVIVQWLELLADRAAVVGGVGAAGGFPAARDCFPVVYPAQGRRLRATVVPGVRNRI